MIENSDLVIYKNGNRTVLNPLGDGNYLWASVSPNNNKLLFTLAGKGTYVTDVNGNVLHHIESAHYPKWSPNGDWLVYMKDYDDGYTIIESDLFVYSLKSETEFKISDTKEIHEMYPVWSKSNDAIYCNTTDGIIYKIELKFN
jgi:Tol biopolymer transport system component